MGWHTFAPLRFGPSAARRTLLWAGSSCIVASSFTATSRANDAGASSNVDDAGRYSIRLSVLNGGQPRGTGLAAEQVDKLTTGLSHLYENTRSELDRTHWLFAGQSADAESTPVAVAGRARPIAGDFNGDGRSETGVFIDGQWFIDLDGNGVWDHGDLWAQLGSADDQPLVGDWDGDGKADIGVFGPDPLAVADDQTAGLPDAQNPAASQRPAEQAGRSVRLMKLGADGAFRGDVVDHVFVVDGSGQAVAGDFNGDGIDTVAIFRNGQWVVDVNGDGQFTAADLTTKFGEPGDRPITGDFNGDGIDEFGVYRDGIWLIADNANSQEDLVADDSLGGPLLLPVVGDWDGDGRDETAVYRSF